MNAEINDSACKDTHRKWAGIKIAITLLAIVFFYEPVMNFVNSSQTGEFSFGVAAEKLSSSFGMKVQTMVVMTVITAFITTIVIAIVRIRKRTPETHLIPRSRSITPMLAGMTVVFMLILTVGFIGTLYYGSLMKRSGIAIGRNITPVSPPGTTDVLWTYHNEVRENSRFFGSPKIESSYKAVMVADNEELMEIHLFSRGGRNIGQMEWKVKKDKHGKWKSPGNNSQGEWFVERKVSGDGSVFFEGWLTDNRWPGVKEIITLSSAGRLLQSS